jgi:hypothetical protein
LWTQSRTQSHTAKGAEKFALTHSPICRRHCPRR